METELWSSKALDLLWLPASPLWHSPGVHRGVDGSEKWYWRVDVSFGAWATRTLTRAIASGARLPGDPEWSLKIIRAYLEEVDPTAVATVDTLAKSPVHLPVDELIRDAAEFARWGVVPKTVVPV
jgi:hypothetical protein